MVAPCRYPGVGQVDPVWALPVEIVAKLKARHGGTAEADAAAAAATGPEASKKGTDGS